MQDFILKERTKRSIGEMALKNRKKLVSCSAKKKTIETNKTQSKIRNQQNEQHHKDDTFLIDNISSWINRGGVQLIPTKTTFLHDSATDAHSRMESPLTTLTPFLELKQNHAGIFMSSSSKISA